MPLYVGRGRTVPGSAAQYAVCAAEQCCAAYGHLLERWFRSGLLSTKTISVTSTVFGEREHQHELHPWTGGSPGTCSDHFWETAVLHRGECELGAFR